MRSRNILSLMYDKIWHWLFPPTKIPKHIFNEKLNASHTAYAVNWKVKYVWYFIISICFFSFFYFNHTLDRWRYDKNHQLIYFSLVNFSIYDIQNYNDNKNTNCDIKCLHRKCNEGFCLEKPFRHTSVISPHQLIINFIYI